MKLEFKDVLQREAIDLFFDINDNLERDITVENADVSWALTLSYGSWGIESFNYELKQLLLSFIIDTVVDGVVESTKLFAEVKFVNKRGGKNYICRIYEEKLVDNKWEEEEYVSFPITLVVDEKPSTETHNRSQIYVKYIELDLNADRKQLKLTI